MIDSTAAPNTPVPVDHTVSDRHCPPQWAEALTVQLDEVLGTSPVLAPGAVYGVRGTYHRTRPEVAWLRLTPLGEGKTQEALLESDCGLFEVAVEIISVMPGRERVLDLVMLDGDGNSLGERLRIALRGHAS